MSASAALKLRLTLEQYRCCHQWAINEESDRCYCQYCGADGDA